MIETVKEWFLFITEERMRRENTSITSRNKDKTTTATNYSRIVKDQSFGTINWFPKIPIRNHSDLRPLLDELYSEYWGWEEEEIKEKIEFIILEFNKLIKQKSQDIVQMLIKKHPKIKTDTHRNTTFLQNLKEEYEKINESIKEYLTIFFTDNGSTIKNEYLLYFFYSKAWWDFIKKVAEELQIFQWDYSKLRNTRNKFFEHYIDDKKLVSFSRVENNNLRELTYEIYTKDWKVIAAIVPALDMLNYVKTMTKWIKWLSNWNDTNIKTKISFTSL